MDLSIITVTHNDGDQIARQLKSVKNGCTNFQFEQFVVDNNSADKTIDIIENNFSEIRLIKNTVNAGFGHANNQAADRSCGEFLLFLNPDMKVEAGSLDKMIIWMRSHQNVGISSCRLIDEKGNFSNAAKPRRFPGVFDQLMIMLKIAHVFPQLLNSYLYKNFNSELEQKVDTVRGSFMIMRREVYEKLGWAFDPRYYIWFEDVDICREVKKMGLEVMYTPIVSCVDYVGQSFKKKETLWKQKNFTKSMVQYFMKWEPWWRWVWIAATRPKAIVLTWIISKFKK